MKLVTAYVDDAVADIITDVAKSSGRSKSEVIKDALRHAFTSKQSLMLITEMTDLERLLQTRESIMEELTAIESRIKSKQKKVELLQEAVIAEWIKDQYNDVILNLDDDSENAVNKEVMLRAKAIEEQWLKKGVLELIQDRNVSEVVKDL